MLQDDRPSSREQLEAVLRLRLDKAAERHSLAKKKLRNVLDEFRQGLTTSPDGQFAIRQASHEENAARDEHLKVLRAFTDLILYGKIPKAEQ